MKASEDLFSYDTYPALTQWNQDIMLCSCPSSKAGVATSDVIECSPDKEKRCVDTGYRDVDNAMCTVARKKRDIHSKSTTRYTRKGLHLRKRREAVSPVLDYSVKFKVFITYNNVVLYNVFCIFV